MPIAHMVALGSSFAAGPGIQPSADAAAGRSERNYAHLVARALGASLVDATVSGATTDTILDRSQRRGVRRFPPQVAAVQPGVDVGLITVTAGGNDLGYLPSLLRAAVANRLSARSVTAPAGRVLRGGGAPVSDEQVEQAVRGLVAVVEAARERAPNARILLVDYLTVIGPGTRPSSRVPFTLDELDRFRGTAARLAAGFQRAADRSSAELVRVSGLSETHALGSPDPWVDGLHLRFPFRDLSSSFHPNAAGMEAVSGAVLRQLGAAGSGTEG